VEGGTSRPDSLAFRVDDQTRWKEHLSTLGVSTEAVGAKLVVVDPDGLRIVLE